MECEWPANHASEPEREQVFHITGSTTVSEVPYFSASGWMLLNMYDGNNDMRLTQDGGKLEIPMATHLAMLNSNHWDMSYGTFPKTMTLGSSKLVHPFPKQAALTAMLALAQELGLL